MSVFLVVLLTAYTCPAFRLTRTQWSILFLPNRKPTLPNTSPRLTSPRVLLLRRSGLILQVYYRLLPPCLHFFPSGLSPLAAYLPRATVIRTLKIFRWSNRFFLPMHEVRMRMYSHCSNFFLDSS